MSFCQTPPDHLLRYDLKLDERNQNKWALLLSLFSTPYPPQNLIIYPRNHYLQQWRAVNGTSWLQVPRNDIVQMQGEPESRCMHRCKSADQDKELHQRLILRNGGTAHFKCLDWIHNCWEIGYIMATAPPGTPFGFEVKHQHIHLFNQSWVA